MSLKKGATLRLSIMLRETALCREVKGTVVPRSSETVVPADLAAASMAGAGAALGAAGAAGAAAAGAGAVLDPAQRPNTLETGLDVSGQFHKVNLPTDGEGTAVA